MDREDGEKPQVVRRSRTVKNIMYVFFFHAKGLVAQMPVPHRVSVTGQFMPQTFYQMA